MPFFKTKAGEGKVANFGLDFDEQTGTEVLDTDVAERLRHHPQFVEVAGKVTPAPAPHVPVAPPVQPAPVAPTPAPVSRETVTLPTAAPAPAPVKPAHPHPQHKGKR